MLLLAELEVIMVGGIPDEDDDRRVNERLKKWREKRDRCGLGWPGRLEDANAKLTVSRKTVETLRALLLRAYVPVAQADPALARDFRHALWPLIPHDDSDG